jgi:cell division protein ZipA
MAELRWVLLALGVLVVAGIWLWSRGFLKRPRAVSTRRRAREEPRISLEEDLLARPGAVSDEAYSPVPEDMDAERRAETAPEEGAREEAPPSSRPAAKQAPEKIITIRLIPKGHELDAREVVAALQESGLRHGRYGIFHMHREDRAEEMLFSVASLTEPGSFDLDNLGTIAGLSFFVVLPSLADPLDCFDAMVEAARLLAHTLNADLFDDRGSSWSIQRERYVREELIRYRHQHFVH